MFQVVYEYQGTWPEEGQMDFHGQFMEEEFSGMVKISPVEAKRRANNYLSKEVAMGIFADAPTLILREQPCWKLSLSVRLPGLEPTDIPGSIEIDALSGELIPLTTEKLDQLLDMADDIAERLTVATTPAR